MTRPFDPDPSPRQWAERLGNLALKGGEYKGPCPLCGGTDRFHVKQGDSQVMAGCRQCDAPFQRLLYATFPDLELDNAIKPSAPLKVNGGASRPAGPKPKRIGGQTWHYFNADGSEFAAVKRADYSDGSKQFFPPKGLNRPYSLYQLPDLLERDGVPVLIVEGEKAADAAQELLPDYAVTTSLGGSKRAGESSWGALAGRDVTIWPDADDAGMKYALDVRDKAKESGAEYARIIDPPKGVPSGWDLADDAPEGFDARAYLDSQTGGIAVVPIAEFMARDIPPRSWLLGNLLPDDGLVMVTAFAKVGKSTLARCLAVAVADPERSEFLDRDVATGTVLHLALEESEATLRDHYKGIGCPSSGIYLWCKSAFDIAPTFEERLEQLHRTIRRLKPVLVVVDTMGRFIEFSDSSHYDEVTPKLGRLIALARQYKTCILLVHHSRKSGGEFGADALGSAAITGSMDTTVSITRNGSGRSYTATGRDGVETDSAIALSQSDNGRIDAAGTRSEATYINTRGKVWTMLHDASPEWLEQRDVVEAVSAAKATVISALLDLSKAGDILSRGRGVKSDPKQYRVNPERP